MRSSRSILGAVLALAIAGCALPLRPSIASISASNDFSCGVVDGGVRCWGSNGSGQLGNPAFGDVSVATDVTTLAPGTNAGVTAVSTGFAHACAVVKGGVQCWGWNGYGQLGDGSQINRTSPVWAIPAGSGATAISAGNHHTCAVVAGAAQCWGGNSSSQLGDGTAIDSPIPQVTISVRQNVTVTAIAAGYDHTCAVVSAGLQCWGNNAYGQLGDATTQTRSTPVSIFPPNTGLSTVSANVNVTCVVKNSQAKCWGYNGSGNLGNNSTSDLHDAGLATAVVGLGNSVTGVAVGLSHACAISAGVVKCWGANAKGQIGDGSTTQRLTATTVSGLSGIVMADVAAGLNDSCVEFVTGAWRCWGEKGHGRLGNQSDVRSLVPLATAVLAPEVAALGAQHGCVLTQSGKVQCWGNNVSGQLGDGTRIDQNIPVDVFGLTSAVTAISTGAYFNCAVHSAGVECWGINNFSQLGDGTSNNSATPTVALNSAYGAVAVATGAFHACAIAQVGVYCWGSNEDGQVGDEGNAAKHSQPYLIPALSGKNVTAIAAGKRHTCAVVNAGVQCWGDNSDQQLGDPANLAAHPQLYSVIPPNSEVTAIAAGDAHTCAVVDGGVQCWGENLYGQLGSAVPGGTATPTQVTGFDPMYGVTNVVAGGNHTCALAYGFVFCWGNGDDGQLGTGTHDNWDSPISPIGLGYGSGETTTAITAGYSHTCAMTTSSGLKCWGDNSYASLGTGALDYVSTPSVVLTNDVIFANRFEVKP